MHPSAVRVIEEALGGSPLSRAAQRGALPSSWYVSSPRTPEQWRGRASEVRGAMAADWWSQLEPACSPSGVAAARMGRVVAEGGVVVTTGQQPGLFGGPLYTWVKAVSALALADALEAATGLPTAPVFWAATDDSDFPEASWTMVAHAGRAERLALSGSPPDGTRMADTPLGDVTPLVAALEAASGSAAEPRALDVVRSAYRSGATIGGAYVAMLRALLEPMGIVVLDAAHPAMGTAAHAVLTRALLEASAVSEHLRVRQRAISGAGYEPQVVDVEGRTLVFQRSGGRRERVGRDTADRVAAQSPNGMLSPNVLLRPVVERALLPTVAYVAGPGEIAYFAQVSAVAEALGAAAPLAVPRWSCTVIEPRIGDLLRRYDLAPSDFADPHAVEARHARAAWPEEVAQEFAVLRERTQAGGVALREALERAGGLLPPSVGDGVTRSMRWQLDRLERRISAAVKRREAQVMQDLATLRAALYPGGVRQERALNIVPLLARHGFSVLEAMRDGAARHARALVKGATGQPAAP